MAASPAKDYDGGSHPAVGVHVSEVVMKELRRFGLVDLTLYLVIVAAAAGARVWYLSAYADGGNNDGPLQVQGKWEDLDGLVQNLTKEDRTFSGRAPFAADEERT